MQTVWMTESLAVTLEEIDFLDPLVADEPDPRERGVRLEIRPVEEVDVGTIYVSPTTRLAPAVCRIDLLESAPGAADRMHWHPVMHDGEPGDRVFEPALSADPSGWLAETLVDLPTLLRRSGVAEADTDDARTLSARAGEIGAAVEAALARLRGPWPEVAHDERGRAPVA